MGVVSYNDYFNKNKKKKKIEEDIAPVKQTGVITSFDDYAKSNSVDLSKIKKINKEKKHIWSKSYDDDEDKIDSAYKSTLKQYNGLSKEEIDAEIKNTMKIMKEKRKSKDYYSLNRKWWDKDKNVFQNVATAVGKATIEGDAKNYNDDYTELMGRYNALVELSENKYVENYKYQKGVAGTVEKLGQAVIGGADVGVKGIETTISKILGDTPDTSKRINEKLGEKALQESKGAEKVLLDVTHGVGRMIPQMLTGNTAIATATGFANYGGGAYNDAIRDGYTDEQATKYGLAIGSLEMVMSKALGSFSNVYGTSKLGGKTQAVIDKIIPKVISNKQVRHVLSQFGSEATEEFLQEYVDKIARDTLLDEKGFLKSTWETVTDTDVLGDALYSAFIGGLTGATMDAPSQIDAFRYEKSTGRDAETGLTANEQKVIDKVVEKETVERQKQQTIEREVNKEIQEQEKTLGTLTDAEKKGIKQSIQEKIDSGELDITGTKLSKKELETIKSEVRAELEKGYIDIDTIEYTFSSKEKAQIRELEQQLANTKSDTEKAQIEAKINELKGVISDNLKGKLDNDTYLQKSYLEETRKDEKFTYDPKETDSEYRKVLTEEFEAKANNTTKAHETYEMLVKMSEDKQTQYHITNNKELKKLGYEVDGKDVNGLVRVTEDGDTRVLVNIDSKKALNRIVGHETTHLLEGTEEYTKLQKLVKEYATTKGDYDTKLSNIKNLYKDVSNADIDGEVTADLVGDYLFTDKDFVNNLSVKEPNIFQKIYNEIKHLYKMATAGSKEARELEKVKKAFEDAYRKNGVKKEAGIDYAISEKGTLQDSNGNDVTLKTSEVSNGNLLVVHSLKPNNLKSVLSLGGIPVGSLAVTTSENVPVLEEFGGKEDILLLFNSDTINPKTKANEVYSRDVYSKTIPTIYEKVDKRALKKVIDEFGPYESEYGSLNKHDYSKSSLETIVNDLSYSTAVKAKFLEDNGYGIKKVYKDFRSGYYSFTAQEIENFKKKYPDLAALNEYSVDTSTADQIKEITLDMMAESDPQVPRETFAKLFKEKFYLNDVIKFYRDIKQYDNANKGQEFDSYATRDNINDAVKEHEEEFNQWLTSKFENLYGDKYFENETGTRKYDYTLENLTSYMKKGNTKAQQKGMFDSFGIGQAKGGAARQFKTLDEIREASKNLVDADTYKARHEAFEELDESVRSEIGEARIYQGEGVFEVYSDYYMALSQAARGVEPEQALNNNWFKNVTKEQVDKFSIVAKELANLPAKYFEAKPQRAITLDEIQTIVIPNTLDETFKKQLIDNGYNVVEYDPSIEGDKTRVVNEQNDLKFSLSNQNENIAPVRGDIYGSDIKLQVEEAIAPLKEDIAKLQESLQPVVQQVETNLTTEDYSNTLTEEDLPYFEQQYQEDVKNLPELDAPVEVEQYNDVQEVTSSMDDKSIKMMSKSIKKHLGLNKIQTEQFEKSIKELSKNANLTQEDVLDYLEDNFGTYSYNVLNDTVADAKADLRETRINVSPIVQSDIADYFKLKQKNFGKIRFSKDGLGVDQNYQELSSKYPDLFPSEIYNESDQFLRMVEVANMDKFTQVNEDVDLREEAEFIYDSILEYRYEDSLQASDKALAEARNYYKTAEAPVDANEEVAPVKKLNRPEGEFKNKDVEPIDLDKSKQLTIDGTEEDLVTKTKRELRTKLLGTEAQKEFILNALDNAKNRSMVLMNNTDTIRNTELVFGRDAGKVINEVVFQKEIDNEADSIAWQNKERQEIKDLGIKARSKESAAVQKYGEKQYVNEFGELVPYTDSDLANEFKDVATQNKIKNAAKIIRQKYDTYIDEANNVLTKLGFDPIKKRNDYMRHFQELNDVFTRYGIPFNAQNMQEHTLPTDINGLTEFWSPQKNYFANMQPRKGIKTTYDAITGVDGYISGIANLIYHTEDIQRGRAFEELIRETYGEDKGFENLDNLPEDLQQARIEKIQDNHLSNYAAWVHEWTNNIAGKKNKIDRSVESMFGRKAFAVLDEIRKQVGSNMIGLNLSSSLTNLIAPVQAMAKTNKLAVAKGTADTIKNMFVKDNFMDNNKFLTARMGTDMISQNAWQKMQNAGYIFMKGMDWFSSNQIVRSKYYELRAKGYSEADAHAESGQFAARIMGDRTKGANPQLYNSKLIGLVTQFQLEVNNTLYSMFYDTYHESKENARGNALKTAAGMTFTLGQLFAFTHLFGQTFESIAGYNPTFDIFEMLKTALGWDDEEDEETTVSERLKKSADMLVDALPYVNILTGGGRIPVTSGIPNLVSVATGGKDEYGNEVTLEDELKKLLYLIPPTGGNQFKKTTQGLSMFDEELPVKGSYTDSGNLRFPVEDTPLNRVQAAVFGQWANENASNYFDNERKPLKEKQIKEFADLDIPIADYWEYREGLSGLKTNKEKIEYINGLDVTDEQKNIMVNNATNTKYTNDKGYVIYKDKKNKNYYYDEKNNVLYDSSDDEVDISKLYELTKYEGKDISNYDDYESYEEFDYSMKNPSKYKLISQIDSYENYKTYEENIADIKKQYRADDSMSSKQKTALSKRRKRAVQDYINSLSLDVPQKLMLQKAAGGYSISDYEKYMYQYLNSLEMTAEEKQTIHNQLFD